MICRVGTTHRPLGKAPWTYPSGTSRPQMLVGKRYSRVPAYRRAIALPQVVHGAHTTYKLEPPNPPKPRSPNSLQLSISRVCVAHPPPTYPQQAPPLPPQDGSVPTISSDKGSSTTPQRLPQWKNTTDNMEGTMAFLLVTFAFLHSRFLDSFYSIYTTPSFVKLGRVSSNDKGALPGYHSLEHH